MGKVKTQFPWVLWYYIGIKYVSHEDIDNSHNMEEQTAALFLFVLCILSLYVLSQLKMTSKQSVSATKVLPQLFGSESDIEENVTETEDYVEGDPDYEAFSSDGI